MFVHEIPIGQFVSLPVHSNSLMTNVGSKFLKVLFCFDSKTTVFVQTDCLALIS